LQNARDAVERVPARFRPRAVAWTALAATAAYLWLVPATPLLTPWTYGRDIHDRDSTEAVAEKALITGAADLRAVSYCTTLAAWWRGEQRTPGGVQFFRLDGERLRSGTDKIAVRGAVGITGYYAGPDVHIIDCYATADPFLAQLPAVYRYNRGHFERELVAGYVDRLRDRVTPIQDARLNQFYQKIELLTHSPDLFSLLRLKTIVAFNLGRYNALLEAYRHQVAERRGQSADPRGIH
jgi:hypothetical protein